MDKKIQVTVKRRVKVIPDRVFGALTDPMRAKHFMFATDNGKMIRVEIEPKIGGRYVFVDQRDGEDVEHSGEIVNIEPGRLIEFDLKVEKYSEHVDRVRIEIENLGHWSEVIVTHDMHEDFEGDTKIMEAGWKDILDKLAKTVEG